MIRRALFVLTAWAIVVIATWPTTSRLLAALAKGLVLHAHAR